MSLRDEAHETNVNTIKSGLEIEHYCLLVSGDYGGHITIINVCKTQKGENHELNESRKQSPLSDTRHNHTTTYPGKALEAHSSLFSN